VEALFEQPSTILSTARKPFIVCISTRTRCTLHAALRAERRFVFDPVRSAADCGQLGTNPRAPSGLMESSVESCTAFGVEMQTMNGFARGGQDR